MTAKQVSPAAPAVADTADHDVGAPPQLEDGDATDGASGTKPPDKAERKAARIDRVERPLERSNTLQSIRTDEERSLRAMMDELGTQGAFKVQIRRVKPASIRINGKDVKTEGYLDTYDHAIDEDFIRREHGGGTYYVKCTLQGPDGSYQYKKGYNRTLEIAGDPSIERLPSNVQAAQPVIVAGSTQENPGIVKAAFDMMSDQIRAERERVVPRGIDPTIQLILDRFQQDADRREQEIASMRHEISRLAHQKPEADPIKDKLLGSLLDGQSGHVTALQLRHEAELRQLKASHIEDIKRIEDRHDRDVTAMRTSHDLALASVRASYEREIAAHGMSSNVATTATKTSHDVQVTTLQADIRRLERDNAEARVELKELREKKDRPLLEQVKDIRTLRDALSDGEESGKASWGEKLVEVVTTPGAVEGIINSVRGAPKAAAAAAPGPAQVAAPPMPRILKGRNGEAFRQMPDGALVPVKKKPKVVLSDSGAPLEIPDIPAAQIAQLVGYLERAFAAGTDPVIMAQSGRTSVPPEILAWIQAHDTEQTSGIDLFLSKVANLPSTSPLSAQSGRNWMRKVGRALIE